MEKIEPFQHAIFFIALLLKFRYLTWPFFITICVTLISNRFYTNTKLNIISGYFWWISLITLILFLMSLAVSFYLGYHEKYSVLALYGLIFASTPIFIPCIIAVFLKPK